MLYGEYRYCYLLQAVSIVFSNLRINRAGNPASQLPLEDSMTRTDPPCPDRRAWVRTVLAAVISGLIRAILPPFLER